MDIIPFVLNVHFLVGAALGGANVFILFKVKVLK